MVDLFWETLLRLPTVTRRLQTLVDSLAQGRSTILLVPDWFERTRLVDVVANQLAAKRLNLFEHDTVVAAEAGIHPEDSLGSILMPSADLHEGLPYRLSAVRPEESAPDVIVLTRLDSLDSAAAGEWIHALDAFDDLQHVLVNEGGRSRAILTIIGTSGAFSVPRGAAYRSVEYWWGTPSLAELQLAVRLVGEEQDEPEDTLAWRQYILPLLCGSSPRLFAALWSAVLLKPEDVLSRALDFASETGMTMERLESSGALAYVGGSQSRKESRKHPSAQACGSWSMGALEYLPECGAVLNSAALAVAGAKDIILNRLWAGQLRLILPIIDLGRVHVCQALTRDFGPDWPVRWFPPTDAQDAAAVRATPHACSYYHLDQLLRSRREVAAHASRRTFLGLAREVRNDLAHCRLVPFETYRQVCRLVPL